MADPSPHCDLILRCFDPADLHLRLMRLGREKITARFPLGVILMIRGRLSSKRCIHSRCRSMRVDSARNWPRFVTTPSICRFRIPEK